MMSGPELRTTRRVGTSAVLAFLALTLSAAPAGAAAKPTALARAVAIAAESRSPVVTLHDLAVSVGQAHGLPGNVVHSSAQHLEVTFETEARAASALGAASSSPTAALASSLAGYDSLTSQVVSATSKSPASLPASFSKLLLANDKKWLGALGALGKADHVNLLSEVPTLLYPKP
jgi:hypothetical protein